MPTSTQVTTAVGEFSLSGTKITVGFANTARITIAMGAGIIMPGAVLGKITASGKYVVSAIGAVDGSQTAVAISLYSCDSGRADQLVMAITHDYEVDRSLLIYHADRDSAAEKTEADMSLAVQGIIVVSKL